MNSLSNSLLAALLVSCASAADAPPALSAKDLAARLSALQRNGSTYVRLQMEVKQAGAVRQKLQLQIKSRRTAAAADVVYQVLWPKERKGEAFLVSKSAGESAAGSLLTLPDKLGALNAPQMKQSVFDSDLCFEDLVDDACAWEHQSIIGTEIVNGISCQILESKSGKTAHSSYGSVRTWVDVRRLVPLRVEKYSAGGTLLRRIDTTRVSTDDDGHHIPANILIRRPGQDTTTELEGSRLKLRVTYADREFTPEGLKDLTAPRSAAE